MRILNGCLKKNYLFFALLLLVFIGLSKNSYGSCAGSSPVWTSTPDPESVASCVGKASPGDTINVIAGNGRVSWGAGAVNIPVEKPLNIIGPGSTKLIIDLTGNVVITINPYIGTIELPATRISGFKFDSPRDAKFSAIRAKGQGWRIDHCEYESIESAGSVAGGFFVEATGINTNVQPYGLIDNNVIINGKIDIAGALNSYDQSVAWADALDLGGPTATYVEDNTFSTSYPTVTAKHLMFDGGYASKGVFRYNTVTNGDVQNHGLQSAGDRGSRKTEFYGNTFHYLNDCGFISIELLAGTGVAFNNEITGVAPSYGLGFELKRGGTSVGCLGVCDGSHVWDGNEGGQSGWLCRDQVGSGGDLSIWSDYDESCSGVPPAQIKSPVYAWNIIGAQNALYNYNTKQIKPNRDYYHSDSAACHAGGASCTTGVGCGTLAARPVACDIGVGYWATEQSCTAMVGMVGANPNTPISGTLYKCTETNTWTAYYQPYTYPHPLRGSCSPSCSGKQCGDDGCGGSCGTCLSGQVCANGQCQASCISSWNCTDWSACVNLQQARACIDKNNCGSTVGKPSESQSCTMQCAHEADLMPCDNCVNQDEIAQYIVKWKGGSANILSLMDAIKLWRRGCY